MKRLSKLEQAVKEQELIEARAVKGMSDTQIMLMFGYKSRQAANRAVNKALAKLPEPPSVTETRRNIDLTADFIQQTLTEIIAHPPGKQSAIGKLTANPDTCSGMPLCDQRLNPIMEQHKPGCLVEPIRDESVRVRAIGELRQMQSVRHVNRVRAEIPYDIAMQQVADYLAQLPRESIADGESTVYTVEVIDTPSDGEASPGDAP